ncbi:unnamed protein product [Rhizophagus irregularis]|nr:unnamed protein product [Rhizophagus irregularis]
MLEKEKAIDWEFGYAMTIHTSQGMTLKSLQRVWVIDKNLAWDNLIYLTVEIEEAKKKRRLKHELRPSIQEKFIRYMGQNKKKGCKFDLTVDYILTLKRIQEDRCALCLIEIKFEWDQPGDISQWTVDQIHNNWGYIKGNVLCLKGGLVATQDQLQKSPCEKQDIKHVMLTQNKESKMSDKTKESDKTKTPDKLDKFLAESLLSRRQSEPVI